MKVWEKERREKNRQPWVSSWRARLRLLKKTFFFVTFLIFSFLLSFGQNFPSFAQKSVSFLSKQFPRALCFSRSVCAWLPPHIFFRTWFEVAIYCLRFDGLLSICALLQKVEKRTKSVIGPRVRALDEILRKRRKKREENVESERGVGGLARQAAYKKKLSSSSSSFVVTFLFFLFLLSFGQTLPSSAQKSASFLLKQFSTAQCFSRSVCAWLPPRIFSKHDLKCPFIV